MRKVFKRLKLNSTFCHIVFQYELYAALKFQLSIIPYNNKTNTRKLWFEKLATAWVTFYSRFEIQIPLDWDPAAIIKHQSLSFKMMELLFLLTYILCHLIEINKWISRLSDLYTFYRTWCVSISIVILDEHGCLFALCSTQQKTVCTALENLKDWNKLLK